MRTRGKSRKQTLQQHVPPPKGGGFVLLADQRRFARNRYRITEQARTRKSCLNASAQRALAPFS
jgi:hypothetical protein